MKNALVVGGANGIGLAIASVLAERCDINNIYIVDKAEIPDDYKHPKFIYEAFDLTSSDYSIFDNFEGINILMITAGFGKLALFQDIPESMIISSFDVNTIAPIRIIKHFYEKIHSEENFYCGVMVSIAGFMSSPFFSVYAATKAALKIFIESVNVELEKAGLSNRILNVSPGSIKGTSFNNKKTNLKDVFPLAIDIIAHLENKSDLFIPQYEEIFKEVLKRYQDDFREEGRHSYDYKLSSKRL